MSDTTVPATAISTSPAESETVTPSRDELDRVLAEYSLLQSQFEDQAGELARLKGSAEVARAKLIEPYAWAVLAFLSVYGGVVGLLLLLQGFHALGFHINDTVMGVIVGSTAVSAIGLVHTVVRGLFPVAKE